MVKNAAARVNLDLVFDELLPLHDAERRKLDRIDGWVRWSPEKLNLPRKATPEHKALAELARTPVLGLVVTTLVQTLNAERAFSTVRSTEEVAEFWKPWNRNRMARQQNALYRASASYGLAYTRVTPGDTGALIVGRSPRDCFAVYRDPANDVYPEYAIEVKGEPGASRRWISLWDAEHEHVMSYEDGKAQYLEPRPHGVGVAPFVRYANLLDLEGRASGEAEPLIPLAARLNKDDYDRLLAQHFNSWKVRTATGLDENVSESEGAERKLKLGQDDILTGGEGVQFGTLDETPLEGYIRAKQSDLDLMAALSQTPITAFGSLINLSADALVEARASLYAKRDERRESFGISNMDTLRLAAHIEGREDDANDFSMRTGWADTESRSMSQAVDALGKAATMLGVPPELLWEYIPGIDRTTAESWKNYAETHAPLGMARDVEAFLRQDQPTED